MSRPLRVLILEDRIADAELLVHELRQADFELDWQRVETEEDYVAAIQEDWDIILADYSLPQFDAARALGILQERGVDIPFIVVTGSTSEEVAVATMRRGATDYLLKDRIARMGPAVTYALEQKRLREETRQAGERVKHLNVVLRVIRSVNQLITKEKDRGQLLRSTCDIIVGLRGYNSAWFAALEEEGEPVRGADETSAAGGLVTVAEAGLGEHFLPLAEQLKRGEMPYCMQMALPQESHVIIEDPACDCPDCPLSSGYGGREALAIRLEHGGRVLGSLTVSLSGVFATNEEEVLLFQELAGDIALALYSIELEEEHTRADEALRESERRYRTLFEGSAEGICIADTETRDLVQANPAFREMFGYSREEVRRMKVSDFHRNEDLAHAMPFFEAQARGEKTLAPGIPCLRKDGTVIFADINVSAVSIGGRRLSVGFFTDVTERKRAQEELAKERNLLRALIDGMPDYIYIKDTEGRFLLTNVAHVRALGARTLEEVVGKTDFDFFPQELAARYYANDQRVVQSGRPVIGVEESALNMTTGEKGWVSVNKLPFRDERGQIIGTFGISRDITERKRAEEERERLLAQIQEQARRVQHIVESVPEGVLLLDADRRVILANMLVRRDLAALIDVEMGDTLTSLGDRPLTELLASPPMGLWHEVTIGGGSATQHFEVVARLIEITPQDDGWVLVIRDVTREREIERQVQQQERLAAVGQLAGGIAHDFNNLLTSIILYAQMHLDDPTLPPDVTRAFETILEESRSAARLVQQILDFSRQAPIKTHPLDLIPFVKDTLSILERTIPESIGLRFDAGADECSVNADPTRIQQVVLNLAVNARDAMSEGGELRIELAHVKIAPDDTPPVAGMPPGDWVCLAVSDTGTGIPADVLPHVFEPFFTTKGPGKGTGLGLAQVHGIVAQHRGFVGVETEPGAGTVFRVYLPAYYGEDTGLSQDETTAIPRGQGETILLVEDNGRVRELEQRVLASMGYRVLVAANGRDALVVLEAEGRVDLVVTDLVMPEMGGSELVRKLRTVAPGLKALAVSGYAGHGLENIEEEGFLDIVYKPFEADALARAVRQVLDTE